MKTYITIYGKMFSYKCKKIKNNITKPLFSLFSMFSIAVVVNVVLSLLYK